MALRELVTYENHQNEEKPLISKEECEHIIYNLTPDRFIENGKGLEEILTTLNALRRFPIRRKDNQLVVDFNEPIHYEILYEKGRIYFNYVIPDKYEEIMVNKIRKVFRTATFTKRKEPDYFHKFENKYYCEFYQKNHFMYSLNTDYRENGLVDGLMGAIANIKSEDTVLLQISIVPLNDSWKEKWKSAYMQQKNGKELSVSRGPVSYIFDKAFQLSESLLDTADMLMGVNEKDTRSGGRMSGVGRDRTVMSGGYGFMDRELGNHQNKRLTMAKVNQDGFQTQIKMFCDNEDKVYYYGKIFDGIFKVLDAEQELEMGRIRKYKNEGRGMRFEINKSVFSTKELSIFLQQPNRRMQMEFRDNLKSIESVETHIPEVLREGKIPIGFANYKGAKIPVYWNSKDRHMAPMHKIIAGLQRTGKSSYIKNYAVEALMKGDSVFVIDTIKNCEVASDIRDYLPDNMKHKVIVLDFSNLDYLLPLAWNELGFEEDAEIRERMRVASQLGGNFESFLETVNESKSDGDKLSPKMKKYLSCACKLVMSQPNTTVKDIVDCLMYPETRHRFITSSGLDQNSSTIQEMLRLDEIDKKTGEITTKYSEISGIIDRASTLFNDYVLEILLSTPVNPDINFTKWADEGYCVLIKASELKFSRSCLKALVTLLYSKIWLSMFARGEGENHNLAHVILDEVHNFPQVTEMLKLNCRETAKYGLSYVFTSHLLKDLKGLLPYIKGSGCNFMLFKTTKENFILMKEELEQGGFPLEDCMSLKDFHTINIVNYNRDYVVFQSKVIDPVENRFIKIDRSAIDLECSKKYGRYYKDL